MAMLAPASAKAPTISMLRLPPSPALVRETLGEPTMVVHDYPLFRHA